MTDSVTSNRPARRRRLAGWLVLACALSGCAQSQTVTGYDELVDNPPADPSASVRQFEPSTAVYENTATVAWSTRMPFTDPDDIKDPARPIVEPFIFITNVVVMPISLIKDPPFKNQYAYRSGGVPETMSAVPPLTDVVEETEGAIVPALKPRVDNPPPPETPRFKAGVPVATERRLRERSQGAQAPEPRAEGDGEWSELVPVRTSRGVVLMKPEDVLAQTPPTTQPVPVPAPQPAVSTPQGGAVPGVVIESVPSTQPSTK